MSRPAASRPGSVSGSRSASSSASGRALLRPHLNSLPLVRQLAGLLPGISAAASGETLAERVGRWLPVGDAITLHGLLHSYGAAGAPAAQGAKASPAASPNAAAADTAPAYAALVADFNRVRSALARNIEAEDEERLLDRSGIQWRPAEAEAAAAEENPGESAPVEAGGSAPSLGFTPESFGPYRRYYLTQQRTMDNHLAPLRQRARQLLAASQPALAEVDALFARALALKEEALQARVPQLLEQRFAALCLNAWAGEAELRRFCRELQALLLAELDFRLQPLLGLMEAARVDSTPGDVASPLQD